MRISVANKKAIGKTIGTISRVTAVVVFLFAGTPTFADEYDDRISELNRQIAANQAQANQYRASANTLANRVAGLNAEIAAAQSLLRKSQAESTRLAGEIAAAEAKLAENKGVLAENLSLIYREGRVSSLEALISSDSLSDFFNKQQYLEDLRNKVQQSLEEITALKAKLEEQRVKQQAIIVEQETIAANLSGRRAEVNRLLVETRGEEAKYQAVVAADRSKVAQLKAEQAAWWARIQGDIDGDSGKIGSFEFKNWTGNRGACGGGYGFDPLEGRDYCLYGWDAIVDRWGLYNRECVSYTAWAMAVRRGRPVPHFGGRGNAWEWPSTLSGRYRIDNNPGPDGSPVVAIAPREMVGNAYGHAMVVEKVYGNGWIKVSQYNWGLGGQYSEMDVKVVPGLKFIHF